MENNLTPLGEQRHILPLRRKIKQLERPWQHAENGARVVAPRVLTWASSKQGSDEQRPGVRLRCGTPMSCKNRRSSGRIQISTSASRIFNRRSKLSSARTRSSTELSPPSLSLRRPKTSTDRAPSSSLVDLTWNGSGSIRLDTTGTTTTFGSSGFGLEEGRIAIVRGFGYRLGLHDTDCSGDAGMIGKKTSLKTPSDNTLVSDTISTPVITTSNFAHHGEGKVGAEDCYDGKKPGRLDGTSSANSNGNDDVVDEDDSHNKSYLSLGSKDKLGSSVAVSAIGGDGSDSGCGGDGGSPTASTATIQRRPISAGISTVRTVSTHTLDAEGDKPTRPRTAGSSFKARNGDPSHVQIERGLRERSCTPNLDWPDQDKEVGSMASWEDDDPDPASPVECRGSVSVVLPILEEGDDARDRRFSPGSATEFSIPQELKASREPPRKADKLSLDVGEANSSVMKKSQMSACTVEDSSTMKPRSKNNAQHRVADGRDAAVKNALTETRVPHISALGYFFDNPRRHAIPSAGAALHGRALVGNHCSRPPSSKHALPPPPALTPGEQSYGPAHPLSPTSMGSPPRRHWNSNWGEEGVPLATEELENSRQTVPFIVSGTMLGWKLSTRARKKSLVESLKTSDYSEHHLIPVYGFRINDDNTNGDTNQNEQGREGGSGMKGMEERQTQLRRLEARALAAERSCMERRSRAEGGEGGAAFARAMCRRARARAYWIQKMGDVHDVRKDNVCHGSSPEKINAYRKRVKNRAHGERLRRRTARGLPSRRPPSVSAVTSRADVPTSAIKGSSPATDSKGRVCHDETDGDESREATKEWEGWSGDGMIQDELGGEPYVMLARARNKRRLQRAGSGRRRGKGHVTATINVPFCPECVGDCHGTCSPDGGKTVPVLESGKMEEERSVGWGCSRSPGPTLKSSFDGQLKPSSRIPQHQRPPRQG